MNPNAEPFTPAFLRKDSAQSGSMAQAMPSAGYAPPGPMNYPFFFSAPGFPPHSMHTPFYPYQNMLNGGMYYQSQQYNYNNNRYQGTGTTNARNSNASPGSNVPPNMRSNGSSAQSSSLTSPTGAGQPYDGRTNYSISHIQRTNRSNSLAMVTLDEVKQRLKEFPRPFCCLLLGARGSGKSTQCEMLEKNLNFYNFRSSEIFIEMVKKNEEMAKSSNSKHIMVPDMAPVLKQVLDTVFPKGGVRKYSGLVIDRWIGSHEYDIYTLDAALRGHGMAVDAVFHLEMSPDLAEERARQRADEKPVSISRRLIERKVQYLAGCQYSALNLFVGIDCSAVYNQQTIFNTIKTNIAELAMIREEPRNLIDETHGRFPPCFPSTRAAPNGTSAHLIPDAALAGHAKLGLAEALALRVEGFPKFPGSLMAGIVDRKMIVNLTTLRRLRNECYVTLKADGERLLLFREGTGLPDGVSDRILGVGTEYSLLYDFTPLLAAMGVPLDGALKDAFILDCECFEYNGCACIAVFDFLILKNKLGSRMWFKDRLDLLRMELASLPKKPGTGKNGVGTFFLKEFVPAPELGKLLPEYDYSPFPIDGVIFVDKGSYYTSGKDKNTFKWKPQEKCTADFRLKEPVNRGDYWCYAGYVLSRGEGGQSEEIPFPGAEIHIPAAVVQSEEIVEGLVVECLKETTQSADSNSIWRFERIRKEKPSPNSEFIAKIYNELDHVDYKSLCKALE